MSALRIGSGAALEKLEIRPSARRARGVAALSVSSLMALAVSAEGLRVLVSGEDPRFGPLFALSASETRGLVAVGTAVTLLVSVFILTPMLTATGAVPTIRVEPGLRGVEFQLPSPLLSWLRPRELSVQSGEVVELRWQYVADRSKEIGTARLVGAVTIVTKRGEISTRSVARFRPTDLDALRTLLKDHGITLHATI